MQLPPVPIHELSQGPLVRLVDYFSVISPRLLEFSVIGNLPTDGQEMFNMQIAYARAMARTGLYANSIRQANPDEAERHDFAAYKMSQALGILTYIVLGSAYREQIDVDPADFE